MFEGFQPFAIQTQTSPDIQIRGLQSDNASSSLPPLLLLHGFPQTLHIWHLVVPHLVESYRVVLMDLRGYGSSSKPDDIPSYAKSAMARDCIAVMDQLGFASQPFFVCAHDRGARVAHKLCVDFPDRVCKTILLDICPTLAMYSRTDFAFAKAYWHWFFLIQDPPLPEMLIARRPREFAERSMGGSFGTAGVRIFDEACFEIYTKALGDPETIRAMCHDYRAAATLDLDEARNDAAAGRLIQSPLLVIWGKKGVIEKCFPDTVEQWSAVAEVGVQVQGYSVDSGHYIPEEAPDQVVSSIKSFLK